MKTEKASTLNFDSKFSKGERASELYVPNEKNSSEEALFCIRNCPHKDKPCKGECKEIIEWLKIHKKK